MLVVFAVFREEPMFGNMVFVFDGQHQLAHVSVCGAGQIRGIKEIDPMEGR